MLSKLSAVSFATGVLAEEYGHGYHGRESDCSNFNDHVGCASGTATRYPDDWSQRAF